MAILAEIRLLVRPEREPKKPRKERRGQKLIVANLKLAQTIHVVAAICGLLAGGLRELVISFKFS